MLRLILWGLILTGLAQAMESPKTGMLANDVYRLFACYRPGCNMQFDSKFELAEHARSSHKGGYIARLAELPAHYLEDDIAAAGVNAKSTDEALLPAQADLSGGILAEKKLELAETAITLRANNCGEVAVYNAVSRVWRCISCNRGFRNKFDVVPHYRTHTGEKPYTCNFLGCEKAYAHISNLRAHEKSHEGRKNYSCACGIVYTRKGNLQGHQRVCLRGSDQMRPEKRKRSSV